MESRRGKGKEIEHARMESRRGKGKEFLYAHARALTRGKYGWLARLIIIVLARLDFNANEVHLRVSILMLS